MMSSKPTLVANLWPTPTLRCSAPGCGDKIKDDLCWQNGEDFYHTGCCDKNGVPDDPDAAPPPRRPLDVQISIKKSE